ncbi:glycosyl hydrolase [Fusarium solani]|uniref:Glycosyl hydrolase n=1 Tax=Fusarium solani TaxID=169388 RepID=A0A9P9KNA8_FUSSL|nr:glycosyl hydrolase [Fusarium solani]KAH7264671.1 glycosyl hydrolase [Fusarium solani]
MADNAQQPARPVEQPRFHFFTNSWINDPCAPGYDPWTKHTTFLPILHQVTGNPEGCEWGNMSWGHAVSKDMLAWSSALTSPALAPDQPYDSQGVFTGCWIPPADAGIKPTGNPILAGEPAGLRVTGFRDPYVTRLPAISEALGSSTMTRYGLISGGIQDVGPTTFLYAIDDNNVEEWTYLGPLVDVPARFQPSKKWSGNYGVNWECTNIVTLHADSESRHFLIIGAEGDVEKDHVKNRCHPTGAPSRTVRGQVWMSGNLTRADDGVKFGYKHGATLITGPLRCELRKGWNGSLAIPREIFLLRVPNVERTFRGTLAECHPFEVKTEADDSMTILTLAFQTQSSSWELEAVISIHSECESVGFNIRHNKDLSIHTTITFCTVTENIIAAPAHLSDGDILEVFANDRFALATMVYSRSYSQENSGITAFANGSAGSAILKA